MLKVPDIPAIRTMFQAGVSKRSIARSLHVSRKTVDKVTAEGYVVEARPRMRLRGERAAPKMDRWKPVVDEWLLKDEGVRRKQRQTARKMYQRLREVHEADVSEVTVRRYVARCKEARAKQAYVPLAFALGDTAQVDFGEADVVLGGRTATVYFIAMRLMASKVSFVKAYPHKKLEAWMNGISEGLSFFGGVPRKLWFDNDTALVKEILAGGRRLQAPEFRALTAHYGFDAVFMNPAAGNEKGGVEKLVMWTQRNLFSPVPEAAEIEGLNRQLGVQCLEDAQTRHLPRGGALVADVWDQERGQLGALPANPFEACRKRFVRVDKTLLCTYGGAQYSAPAAYAQKTLTLRAFWDHVELADRERTVAEHRRRAPGEVSLDLAHYLPVLAHRPRAVMHAAVIAHGEPVLARYRDAFLAARPGACRELVAILRLTEEVGLPRMVASLELALRHAAFDVESVRAVLAMDSPAPTPEALAATWLERWPDTPVRAVSCEAYAWLDEAAAGGETH